MNFSDPLKDPRDTLDDLKWDLPTNNLHKVYHDGYMYKLNNKNDTKGLKKLVTVRQEIDRLCVELYKQMLYDPNFIPRKIDGDFSTKDPDLINGLFVFFDIHGPLDRSDDERLQHVPHGP